MSAGPFKWKQGVFGPELGVLIEAHEIRLTINERLSLIDLRTVRQIYVHVFGIAGVSHIVELAIATEDQKIFRIGVTGQRSVRSFEFEECMRASRAILEGARSRSPHCDVFFGLKPPKWGRALLVVSMLAVFVFASLATWRHGGSEDPEAYLISLATAVTIFIFFTIKAIRDVEKLKSLGHEEALATLEWR